jgi:hypothetical protein
MLYWDPRITHRKSKSFIYFKKRKPAVPAGAKKTNTFKNNEEVHFLYYTRVAIHGTMLEMIICTTY